MTKDIATQIAEIKEKNFKELKVVYDSLFDVPAPKNATRSYLYPRIVHRLQELEFGGLKKEDKAKLEKLVVKGVKTKTKTSINLLPGTKIQRQWRGKIYEVEVLENGFCFEGQKFKSLSALAKHITGTIWNGRMFFGIKN